MTTTTPTNNPIPSESPRDLSFNAGKVDEFVNSPEDAYSDRFGIARLTISGIENQSQSVINNIIQNGENAVISLGFTPIDSFEAGATISSRNQSLHYLADNNYYRWDGVLPKVVASGSTPSSSGGVSLGAWVNVTDNTLRSQLASMANGNGDALVTVKKQFTGAVARNQHSVNQETASVYDFGVIGDGVTDDTAALQSAMNSGVNVLLIPPSCTIKVTSRCNMPAANFTLLGSGATSVITGNSSVLVGLTKSSNIDASGNVYICRIEGVKFTSTVTGATLVDFTGVWQSFGTVPHVIHKCIFDLRGISQKCINLTGIWAADITNCSFFQHGQDHKGSTGGIGIGVFLTTDINSSVMNITIADNDFTLLSFPINLPNRELQTGGRIEGIQVVGNNLVAGNTGILAQQVLALAVSGNQISDYGDAIHLVGCFDCNITGNSEISADNAAVRLEVLNITSGSGNPIYSVMERVTITGNGISSAQSGSSCIVLSNTVGDQAIRNINISSNAFRGAGNSTSWGILFSGAYVAFNVNIIGNSISNVLNGFQVGDATSGYSSIKIKDNAYTLDAGGVVGIGYTRTVNQNLYTDVRQGSFSGALTTLSIDVTSAAFLSAPLRATLDFPSAAGARATYVPTSSTATSLFFAVTGTLSSGTNTYTMDAYGYSRFGF